MNEQEFGKHKEELTTVIASSILNTLEEMGPVKTREISWFSMDVNKINNPPTS